MPQIIATSTPSIDMEALKKEIKDDIIREGMISSLQDQLKVEKQARKVEQEPVNKLVQILENFADIYAAKQQKTINGSSNNNDMAEVTESELESAFSDLLDLFGADEIVKLAKILKSDEGMTSTVRNYIHSK